MKQSLPLIIACAAVLILLAVLSTSGKKPLVIPRDAMHANATKNEDCAPCHAPGKRAPVKDAHPPKEQCVICHAHAQ